MNETPKTKPAWRIARYILIALAVIATLIAVFYTEEDLRGKLAWEQSKSRLEAQGMVLDWNKYLPPSIPDDQNFYTASSNILLRFKQIPDDDTNELEAERQLQWLKLYPLMSNGVPPFPVFDTTNHPPPTVAEIIVSPVVTQILVSPAVNPVQKTNILTVALNDLAAPGQIRDLLQATVGQSINGAQGFKFSERRLTDILPAQIFVRAQTPPSIDDLAGLIPSDTLTNIGRLKIVTTADQNIYRVLLTRVHITAAADYLKWSDQYVSAFDEIREALKRPYAILPGDYSQPYQMPIPNFVTMRGLAQTLAQRAQCYLLLGEPDKALHELTLVHDVCRILEKPPTGQPETLVEAMINVAINGLYVSIIEEGIKRHAWQEPQLEAFQEQLAQINLSPNVKRAFAMEMAAAPQTIETISYSRFKEWLSYDPAGKQSLLPLLEWVLIPRGWFYQNMVTSTKLKFQQTEGFDSPEGIIQPKKFVDISHALRKIPMRYKFVATITIFNVTKALQTTAYNQTLVNEAQIACALERCHLAHGEYPDTLDALVPGYLETIPQDIIGGQPLHYRRTDDGKFLLYSIGWNERDDGGQVAPHNQYGGTDYTRGDWVWLGGIE